MGLLDTMTFGKAVPIRDGKSAVWKFSDCTIVCKIIESDLSLDMGCPAQEIPFRYCDYIDILVFILDHCGEKTVSKMGDTEYTLDISKMDFYATDYNVPNEQWEIEEIVLNQNSSISYIDLISMNGEKRISLCNSELKNIENLAFFANKLINFVINNKK